VQDCWSKNIWELSLGDHRIISSMYGNQHHKPIHKGGVWSKEGGVTEIRMAQWSNEGGVAEEEMLYDQGPDANG
jgi:hypothetical protein